MSLYNEGRSLFQIDSTVMFVHSLCAFSFGANQPSFGVDCCSIISFATNDVYCCGIIFIATNEVLYVLYDIEWCSILYFMFYISECHNLSYGHEK